MSGLVRESEAERRARERSERQHEINSEGLASARRQLGRAAPRNVVFRLKLPEPVLVQLKACARARGVAPTLLVRELLDRYIDDLEEDGITT